MKHPVPIPPGQGVYQVFHLNDLRSSERSFPENHALVATIHARDVADAARIASAGGSDPFPVYRGALSVPLRPTGPGDVITDPYGQEWAVGRGGRCDLMFNPALYADNPRLAEQVDPMPYTPAPRPKERDR